MGVQLLDKTRKINKLLHNNNSSKVVFNDICDVDFKVQHSGNQQKRESFRKQRGKRDS